MIQYGIVRGISRQTDAESHNRRIAPEVDIPAKEINIDVRAIGLTVSKLVGNVAEPLVDAPR
jgi:hypothetical protein